MKQHLISFILISLLYHPFLFGDNEQLSALDILSKVDEVVNAPLDQELKIKLILIDNRGGQEEREIIMYQKGSNKRVAKFLSPASQRGIGVLSLPNDVMYLYLPAFKKTRRIASHIKNTRFAGTDFTYEDMEAIRYSDRYTPELIKHEQEFYTLLLKPKDVSKTEYSKLILRVRVDNYFPIRIEYYDKSEQLVKVLRREKIEKVGKYLVSKESEMENIRDKHISKMLITEAKFDTGLSEEIFTERFLMR
ncbi:MAG: outer membrane lipoprotein-sorting protein [Bacteroidetes bacterium]|nr:outer membrane lipoprotein-sorting protein [Bacteroidota bacterium]